MADTTELRGLLGRVQRAQAPNRRLDYELFCQFAAPEEANPWDPTFGNHFTNTPATRNCAAIALRALIARAEGASHAE